MKASTVFFLAGGAVVGYLAWKKLSADSAMGSARSFRLSLPTVQPISAPQTAPPAPAVATPQAVAVSATPTRTIQPSRAQLIMAQNQAQAAPSVSLATQEQGVSDTLSDFSKGVLLGPLLPIYRFFTETGK